MRYNPVRPKKRSQLGGTYLREKQGLSSERFSQYQGGRQILTPEAYVEPVWLGTVVNGKNMRPYFVGALRQVKPVDLESALDAFPVYFERGVYYEGDFFESFELAALYNEDDFRPDLVQDAIRVPTELLRREDEFSLDEEEYKYFLLENREDVEHIIKLGSASRYSKSFFVYVPAFGQEVEAAGRGYFEEHWDTRYAESVRETGFRRIHSVSAISEQEQGTGLGLAVYTAGTMYAAYLDVVGNEDFPGEGAGISSGAGASESASLLWRKLTKSGLAEAFPADAEEFTDAELETLVVFDEIKTFSFYVSMESAPVDSLHTVRDSIDAKGIAQIEKKARDFFAMEGFGSVRFLRVGSTDVVSAHSSIVRNLRLIDDDGGWVDLESFDFRPNLENTKRYDTFFERSLDFKNDLRDQVEEATGATLVSFDSFEVAVEIECRMGVTLELEARNFAYSFESAVNNGLVLDVNPKLVPQFAEAVPDSLVLEIIKNLDAREIEDPQALDYFVTLLERFGGTPSDVTRFLEEAAEHLPVKPTGRGFDAQFRLNPDDVTEEKQAIARDFFGYIFES